MEERIKNKIRKNNKKGLTNGMEYDIITFANRRERILAGVAELADARDLKSRDAKASYRFDPGHRHHLGGKGKGKQNIAE